MATPSPTPRRRSTRSTAASKTVDVKAVDGSSAPDSSTPAKAGSNPPASSGSGSGSGGAASDKDVVVLTDASFDAAVMGSKDIWVVEFYAPWCGHCKALEPEYNEAAAKLKSTKGVKLAKVDATVET